MKKRKILFIVNHRKGRSPGQRFRFEQYLDFLEDNGFHCEFSNFISEQDDKILYNHGNYLGKLNLQIKAWKTRLKDSKRVDDFDIVFIYREALLTGSTYFEKKFAESTAKVVVDYDDAIWLPNVSAGNRALQMLKNPSKSDTIFSYADMLFAGNDFLANYGKKFCPNVKVIPTTIDTNYHLRKTRTDGEKVCIGWTGTQTTLRYLDTLKPVFRKLSEKYGEKIYLKVICDVPWESEEIEVLNEKWSKEDEIQQLEEIDIGIMPLTVDQWSKGKCGFKGLQYMAMESAAILSPVGVNKDIIEHNKNGFLAETERDWFDYISLLIDDKEMRMKLGKEGRKTIEEKFSVNAHKERYLYYLKELLEEK